MRIDLFNNRTGVTTVKNIPFSHKDFAENEKVFLNIYYEQLTDVLAGAIFAHRHDNSSYYNIISLHALSSKIVSFLTSAGKKNHGYNEFYELVRVAKNINATAISIINPDPLNLKFDGDKSKIHNYIEQQYTDLFRILTHILPTYKKGV